MDTVCAKGNAIRLEVEENGMKRRGRGRRQTYLGINISCGEAQEEHVTCVRVKSLAFFSNQHRLESTPSTPKHCLQTHVFAPSRRFIARLVALNPTPEESSQGCRRARILQQHCYKTPPNMPASVPSGMPGLSSFLKSLKGHSADQSTEDLTA